VGDARPGDGFQMLPGVNYKYNYLDIFTAVANGRCDANGTFRALVLDDLFFLVYFVLGIKIANHKFWVDACKDVESGPTSRTVDVWARCHGKTSVITIAETIQCICRNPNITVGIFSHTRPIAKGFLRSIKQALTQSEMLKAWFPDVFYADPEREAPKWSEDDGIIVKRVSYQKEATVEAWGMLEGMPTGKHFDRRVYDDIEVADLVDSPDIVRKLRDRFELSQNLGTSGGTERIIGTYYTHEGLLTWLRDMKYDDGTPVYQFRVKPATHDGTPNGIPVYQTREELDRLRAASEYIFNCQQLLNPSPVGVRKLDSSLIKTVTKPELPKRLIKFLLVDQAGDSDKKASRDDAWAFGVVGIDPNRDDTGASSVYILDLVIEPMREAEALEDIVRMYMRNGLIQALGVEKVALSSTHRHIADALRAKGKRVSEEKRSMVLLHPAGRNKVKRIESALSWPLENGKIHILDSVPKAFKDRLFAEMDKFPYWHDDGLDMLSYLWDILHDYNFNTWAYSYGSQPIRYVSLGLA
jgi:hypothetical protein